MNGITKITAKQERFIAAYNGNATTAATVAGYAKPRHAGSRFLTNVVIMNAIKCRQDVELQPLVATRQERQEFWTQVMMDAEEDMKNRLRASELLGKSMADFTDNVALKHDLAATLKAMSDEEVQARLNNLYTSGQVKFPSLDV